MCRNALLKSKKKIHHNKPKIFPTKDCMARSPATSVRYNRGFILRATQYLGIYEKGGEVRGKCRHDKPKFRLQTEQSKTIVNNEGRGDFNELKISTQPSQAPTLSLSLRLSLSL